MRRLIAVMTAAAASLPMTAAHAAPQAHHAPRAQAAAQAHTARGAKLEIRHTSLGSTLANGRGFTLYMFTRDSANHDRCVTISGCTGIWPALTSNGTPHLGAGVRRALVGTVKLPGGAHQVTYAGHPLYTYIGDSGPGDTSYVGQSQFGGRWFALTAGGQIVK